MFEAPVVGVIKGRVISLAILKKICHVGYSLVIHFTIIYTFKSSIRLEIDKSVQVEIHKSIGGFAVELSIQPVLVIVILSRLDEGAAEQTWRSD